ncbi:MAG: CRTAC1 family protein [Candidatus Aminicenantes bacterium]|nr:CRTAC1 family protein [Candidatus Aminicenantes bacterium]
MAIKINLSNSKCSARVIIHIAIRITGVFLFLLAASFCSIEKPAEPRPPEIRPEIKLVDATESVGLTKFTRTFGAAAVDINNDYSDDLIISNHGCLPSLYLNINGIFEDHSFLLPEQKTHDLHGVTAVDLDNDGDKDLIFAGGGSDGIGAGHANRLYRNLLSETGAPAFDDISLEPGISYPPWRARHFLPLPGSGGSLIDLYLVCLSRENCPNIYFSNHSGSQIELLANESPDLNRSFHSKGKDIFFDYDRDGDMDLLIILKWKPAIFERIENRYLRNDSILQKILRVTCVGTADLNNDGYPDLFFGTLSPESGGDNISCDDKEIHFVVKKQENDPADRISFNSTGEAIAIDFIYRIPGKMVTDAADIFIGQNKRNPLARKTSIDAETAAGEPLLDEPGTYIWKEPGAGQWHVTWVYSETESEEKGKITAGVITDLLQQDLETLPARKTQDRVFINKLGKKFEEFQGIDLTHHLITRSVTMCDLDNNGFVDIVGIRGSEAGRYNGEPFVLINHGMLLFEFKNIMQNREDDIYQADQLIYGFFNDDGLPDLFFTNGAGLNPGFCGPYKLFLNYTENPGNYVILELEGTTANKDALGAEVEIFTPGGDFLGYRRLGAGFNRSQSSHKIHFGLGDYKDKLFTRIKWPGTTNWDEREVTANKINFIKQ